MGQKYAVQRALSSGRTSAAQPTAARATYESTLLKAVRTQIESFEEKVGSQINSLRDQQQSDRLREAAFARLEEKMSTAEGNQPKLDRRLAELAGNFKGLSDEMQAQIRRVDLMDERLWEWRRQFEEDFRQKHAELESSIQKVPSSMRVMVSAVEENQKRLAARLQRLEAESSDRNILHDETRESVNHLFARFETLENQHLDHIEIAKAGLAGSLPSRGPTLGDDSVALIGLLEQRLDDLMGKVERMFQDTHETHARVAEQEEQHKTMRTLLDQNDGQVRLLKEKVENGNWDVKLDLVKQAVQEESKQKIAQHERIELLAKRLEFQEQAQEDLRSAQQRLPPMRLLDCEDITTNGGPSVQECFQRLDNAEQTLDVFAAQMESMRADAGLGPRMAELVAQLKDMVPKVIEHDRLIKEVQGGGVPPEIYAEMSSIRSEVDAWRQSVSGDEAAQPQLKQLIEKLREEVKQVGAVPTAFHGEMDAMKRELSDLKSQTQDAHPGMQADFAALKQELISLKSEPQAVLRDLGALKQELQSSRSLPQEPHPSVTADLEALKQHLSDLKSKPQEAHPAVLQDLERIKHEMNSLKAQPQEVHPTVLQDLENLKQDLRSLKSQPKVSSEDLAPHVEQLNLELRSYIDRHASQAGGAGGASKEALQEAVNMLRSEIGASREETQRGFHEHLRPVKEEMRGMRELRTSEDEAARAATVELRALQSELLSFKDRGQSHVEDTCSKEELSRLTALATESKQISSSVLEEMDRLRKDMSTLREASKAAPARDDQEVVLQELRRIAELSASNQEAAAGAMRDVADVRRQLGEAKASSSQDAAQAEELRQLREVALEGQRTASSVLGEVEGLRKRVEAGQAGTAGIERLKADVEALQAELAKEEKADHERLLARVDGLCDRVAEASQSSTADVQALRLDMDALKAQVRAVAAAPPAAGAAAAPAAAADDDLSEDDEAEHRAHVRLLERVDEVCERLDEVDRALSASALATPQAGAAGIPAKFADKLDAVIGRVEHLQSVEQRMEAKFSQFTEKMQASRSAPRSSPLSPYD